MSQRCSCIHSTQKSKSRSNRGFKKNSFSGRSNKRQVVPFLGPVHICKDVGVETILLRILYVLTVLSSSHVFLAYVTAWREIASLGAIKSWIYGPHMLRLLPANLRLCRGRTTLGPSLCNDLDRQLLIPTGGERIHVLRAPGASSNSQTCVIFRKWRVPLGCGIIVFCGRYHLISLHTIDADGSR